jgi:glucosylceramidase
MDAALRWRGYLDNGASSYFAWNMVLDETGMSTWNWRQNALITADTNTGKITLNGEYYVMRHFSQFVRPGARRALLTGPWGDKIGLVNADGSTVLVIGNSARDEQPFTASLPGRTDGHTFNVTLPPRSINTFVIPAME